MLPKNVTSPGAQLFLHEELTLLALRDHKGTFQIGPSYDYAVGGAVLAELLLNRRIGVDDSKRQKMAKLLSSKPLGDPLIDECLGKVIRARRPASLRTWVSRFACIKKLRPRIGAQLCRRGILRADEDKVLWVFTRQVYPEVDPAPERRLIDRMKRAISTSTPDVDPRTVVIISLAKGVGLLGLIFDKKMLRRRKPRLEQISNGDVAGKATREAIEAMQAAVFAACIIPTVTATTAVR